jgi:hypothetical protein
VAGPLRKLAIVAYAIVTLSCASKPDSARSEGLTDMDALVMEVLRQAFADPKNLPDRQLLPANGPITIRAEVLTAGHGITLKAAALPVMEKTRLQLLTLAELQELADRRRGPVYFVAVNNVAVNGEAATAWVGVDLVTPSTEPSSVKLCCCRQSTAYRRSIHGWQLVSRDPTVCL